MTFALSKDEGGYKYPRIIRYVDLESNILAMLDARFNLLQIDKNNFEHLTEEDKQTIIKTHATVTHCYLDRSGITRIII